MNRKASFVSVARVLSDLSDEELAAVVEKPELLKQFAAKLLADLMANTYVVALSDDEVVKLLVKNQKFPDGDPLYVAKLRQLAEYSARKLVASWRKLASDHGYTGPIAWQVRAGFTLKSHAPQAGPCYEQFGYLQDWELKNDEPTVDSIVFWVPRLLEGSVSKNVEEQKAFMTDVRVRYELPEHHMSSFGSAALMAGLVLAHFKRTGERTPLRNFYARSDTFHAGGNRLDLGNFDENGLSCDGWDDGARGAFLGVFPLGVELGR